MKQFQVTGMSCAACSARVEKAVRAVPGVESCSVSLLTNSMGVEGAASPEAIIRAVEAAGYGASRKDGKAVPSKEADSLADTETPKLRNRLIASVLLLLPLLYISMGHMMWGWKLPPFFEGNHVAAGLLQLLLAAAVLVVNQRFFRSGIRAVLHKSPNMDTLVAMGSGVSFLWSVFVLFRMTGDAAAGNSDALMQEMSDLYFEAAAMILTLITVGKMLEAHAKGRTTDALKGLMALAPKTAAVIREGREEIIPAEEVCVGDLFVIRPGEQIPVDGIVQEGESAVDESALTGESVPVDKSPGSSVSSGTVNRSGFLRCQAVKVGEDTALSQIIRMVSDAAATKAPIAKLADRVAGIFVPVVIGIALLTLVIWLAVGQTPGYALARAISVLVISCPCALGLATPVSIMVGSGVGARNGILFKTAVSLEETGKAQIIVLDKTGTVTQGTPSVTDVFPAEAGEEELLRVACALESKSEHPLAGAVSAYAKEKGFTPAETSGFRAVSGSGLTAELDGEICTGGNRKFVSSYAPVSAGMEEQAKRFADAGKTPLFFAKGSCFLGIIAVADTIREDSAEAIHQMQQMGLQTILLTGDNERTAQAIGRLAGVHQVVADVLPDGKEAVIRALQQQGKVVMIGDGINDAPALTRADIGIAVGAGTDIAMDAADVVLMKSRLTDAAAAIRLSRGTLRNIRENLFWAFIYNIIGIPLAAGVYIPLFGWELNPMFGAAAMSLSSFCVVTNALRLNLLQTGNPRCDRPARNALPSVEIPEFRSRTHTFHVEGMMCPHCEATVRKCLEAFPEVQEAKADHEQGTAVITLSGEPVHLEAMRKAIIEKGYQVISG